MTATLTRDQDGAGERQPAASDPRQGVIEDARGRQRLRRVRTAALVALAIGLLAAALAALGDGRDHQDAARSRHVSVALSGQRAGFALRLSPALDGGQNGWCVGVEEGADEIGGGCSALPAPSRPLVATYGSASATPPHASLVVLTTPAVTSVLVNGDRRVPTVALPGLPYGLRAARILLRAQPVRNGSGRLGVAPWREPTLVALDVRGRRVAASAPAKGSLPLSGTGSGPCSIRASGLPGLAPQWSHVVAAIRPYPGPIIGHAFFSCIDTEYYLRGWPLDAAILLDAARPSDPPAPVPGLITATVR